MVNVREMVSFDPVWDPTLAWYERAVQEMKTKRKDETSWDYQAAIHGTLEDVPRNTPWNTCEHGGYYFFPWHRAYLSAFEKIVRSIIVSLGGPDDWALPYWNYEEPGKDALPPAFRSPKKDDGTTNYLYIEDTPIDKRPDLPQGRYAEVNKGTPLGKLIGLLRGAKLSSAEGMSEQTFSGDGSSRLFPFGFGGGPTPSGFLNASPADIEQQLHGNVHTLVGLGGGLMSVLNTAAQDPVFWLHHSNIDRLWAVWAKGGHTDPQVDEWRNQQWTFFTPEGKRTQIAAQGVENTVGQLQYRYDVLPEPVTALDAAAGPPIVGDMAEQSGDDGGQRQLQPVGWSQPVTLQGHETSASVTVDQATLDSIAPPGLDAPSPVRSYLELSDITAKQPPGILYGVHLHRSGQQASDDALVGVVSFFGVPAPRSGNDRHRHRLRYTFDITDALQQLGGAQPDSFSVIFRPLGPAQVAAAQGLDAGEPDVPAVTVGRVALVMG